jgi:nucleolar pre-ribosomal-associated protein 2
MSCFFVLHPKSNATKSQRAPLWLSSTDCMLNIAHANAYVRVLHSFSHPTVSSVSKSHNSSSALTDETRKARKYAAEYIPYLLTHYCGLLLVGRISQDVRSVLMPGIWACIEIIPDEKLKAMSARMNSTEREIWRTVWAEWRRAHGHET